MCIRTQYQYVTDVSEEEANTVRILQFLGFIRQLCPAVQWVNNTFFPIYTCLYNLANTKYCRYTYTVKKLIFSLLVFSSGLNPGPFRKRNRTHDVGSTISTSLCSAVLWIRIRNDFPLLDPDPYWECGFGSEIRSFEVDLWSSFLLSYVPGTFFDLLPTSTRFFIKNFNFLWL